MRSHDVIVVGLGAMGAAALWSLAGRGVRVLGIDPRPIGHAEGSSGGDSRLIRKAYFEHADYVPLLERSYRLWRGMEAASGRSLLLETGTLYLGRPDSELIAGSRHAAATHGIALHRVDDAELARRFPNFRRPEDYVALFEPEAGLVLCERAVRTAVELAAAAGADTLIGERVVGWSAQPAGVTVQTDRGRYLAGALVLTAGAWSAGLLNDAEVALKVTRQPLFWVAPEPDRLAAWQLGRTPCWAVQRPDRPGLFYGFPALPGSLAANPGVKLAHHVPGEAADPDQARRPVDPAELATLRAAVAPLVGGLSGRRLADRVCLYTMSADGHFVVDRHARHANLVFGCGFSGHGFKFAPVIGEALADLATDGASSLPIGFLGRRPTN